MKLWDKGYALDASIEAFTIGKDRELDLLLAPYDILGTMTHVTMLASVGLLTEGERDQLLPELRKLQESRRKKPVSATARWSQCLSDS